MYYINKQIDVIDVFDMNVNAFLDTKLEKYIGLMFFEIFSQEKLLTECSDYMYDITKNTVKYMKNRTKAMLKNKYQKKHDEYKKRWSEPPKLIIPSFEMK
jgi:hypothetical protein